MEQQPEPLGGIHSLRNFHTANKPRDEWEWVLLEQHRVMELDDTRCSGNTHGMLCQSKPMLLQCLLQSGWWHRRLPVVVEPVCGVSDWTHMHGESDVLHGLARC